MKGSTSEIAPVLELTFQGHVQKKNMPNCVNLRDSINARGEARHNYTLPLPVASPYLFHCVSTRKLCLLLFWSSAVGPVGENLLHFLPLSSQQDSTGTSSSSSNSIKLTSVLQTRAGWRVRTGLFCHDSHPLF